MNKETKALFDHAVQLLIGDTTLPDDMSTEDLAAAMQKFYNAVITKAQPDTDKMLVFFMTFLAGYLCGHTTLASKQGKDPWEMGRKRN